MGGSMANITYPFDSGILLFFGAQKVVNVKVFRRTSAASVPTIFSASSGAFLSARFGQIGDDTAPNKWTFIWYFSRSCDSSLSGHQRKRRKSRWPTGTRTWWNIASISPINVTASWRNLVTTPTSRFARWGPFGNLSLSDTPRNLALQSNTTLILFGFLAQ